MIGLLKWSCRFLASLALLAVCGPARAGEVTVRVLSLRSLHRIRILPRAEGAWIRACPACPAVPIATPLTLRAVDDSVSADPALSVAEVPEVWGTYRVEIPDGHPEEADDPLEIRANDGELSLTLRMPLEEYVAKVLAGESSRFRSEEALKAMAITVRTYAVRFEGRHRSQGYDFCDSTHCQRFVWKDPPERLRAAVEATEGELIWHEGKPAAAYYHRNCGGTTEAGRYAWSGLEAPYLVQQADAFCQVGGGEEWRSEIRRDELAFALASAGVEVPAALGGVKVLSRTPSGRVRMLGTPGKVRWTIAGATLRRAVGRALGWNLIRSDLYEVRGEGDRLVFRGRGAGHGVGLCQDGAARMGEEGKSTEEIVSFYFPGTVPGITAQGLAWRALGGERVEVLTIHPREDERLAAVADRLLSQAESRTGWECHFRPRIKIYPTVASFRDATGEPGWVAASTKGRIIRLEPLRILREKRILEATLVHELTHLLVESRAAPGIPLWFREGLVGYLTEATSERRPDREPTDLPHVEEALRVPRDPRLARQAVATAAATVRSLIETYGRPAVLSWVERGLPGGLGSRPGLHAQPAEERGQENPGRDRRRVGQQEP